MLLWAAVAPTSLVFFQWAQPTVLGFAVFGSGLILAAVNYVDDEDEEEDDEEDEEEGDEEEDDDPGDDDDTDDDEEPARPLSELELQKRRMRGL